MTDQKIELHRIDIRNLSPMQWERVMGEAARQARRERSLACRDLFARAWRGILGGIRQPVAFGRRALETFL